MYMYISISIYLGRVKPVGDRAARDREGVSDLLPQLRRQLVAYQLVSQHLGMGVGIQFLSEVSPRALNAYQLIPQHLF